jgi:hypothetical protein
MDITTFAFIYIVTSIIIGGFCSWIAGEKGYGQGSWFFLGFLFSIVALISISGAPLKGAIRAETSTQNSQIGHKPKKSGTHSTNGKSFTPDEETAINSIPEDFFNSLTTEYESHENIDLILKNYKLITGFYVLNKNCESDDLLLIKEFFRDCEYV